MGTNWLRITKVSLEELWFAPAMAKIQLKNAPVGCGGGGLSPGTPPHLDFEPKISQKEARRVQKEGLGKAGCGSVDSGWEGVTLGQLGPPFTVSNNISKEGLAVGNGKE